MKIVLKRVPYEFTKGFKPTIPLILGGLLAHESTMGIITARVKRHRWHKKVLKSDDVLTFSVGWRRYQVFIFNKTFYNFYQILNLIFLFIN